MQAQCDILAPKADSAPGLLRRLTSRDTHVVHFLGVLLSSCSPDLSGQIPGIVQGFCALFCRGQTHVIVLSGSSHLTKPA